MSAVGAPKPPKRILTIGDVARLTGFGATSCTRWCDTGLLRCHRMPGGLDRRIYRDDLLRFARENGIRLDCREHQPVYLAGVEQWLLPDAVRAASLMELAYLVALSPPRAVVIAFGRGEMLEAGRLLRAWLPDGVLVALLADDMVLDCSWADYNAALLSPYAGLAELVS